VDFLSEKRQEKRRRDYTQNACRPRRFFAAAGGVFWLLCVPVRRFQAALGFGTAEKRLQAA
jgi:hypothetical protein